MRKKKQKIFHWLLVYAIGPLEPKNENFFSNGFPGFPLVEKEDISEVIFLGT